MWFDAGNLMETNVESAAVRNMRPMLHKERVSTEMDSLLEFVGW